jgi:hypothetical protein
VSEGQLRVTHAYALGTTGTAQILSTGSLLVGTGVTLANANLTVSGGSLVVDGTVLSVNLESGRIGGKGTIGASVSFNDMAADILSPGASTGVLNFGVPQTWSGLSYQWEVSDFVSGTPGLDFDAVLINGALALDGTSYALDLVSLSGLTTPGPVANFSEISRQWNILTASSGITGFDASEWSIDSSGFTAAGGWTGDFSLAQTGNNLVLSYSPVPEPGVTGLLLGALTLAGLRRRRSRRD